MLPAKKKKIFQRTAWVLLTGFILVNIVACFHAYKFTHFTNSDDVKAKTAIKLSTVDKIKTLLLGIDNPRPVNRTVPAQKFETITLHSNKTIECWRIKADSAKGTVIIFHGYGGQKSSMIGQSDEFIKLGYNTLLVDFMGSGGSEGNQTTIGAKEAEEVKTCYDYLKNKGEKNIYLFGSSMGAAAVLKSLHDYDLNPAGIIIECPFGSMYTTVCARFHSMKVPAFPMAGLLVFWGGVENGFWAFGHNPAEYAKAVECPTLLIYGEQDDKVSRKEIDEIYANLDCKKTLCTYPLAGHANYFLHYKREWQSDVGNFLAGANR